MKSTLCILLIALAFLSGCRKPTTSKAEIRFHAIGRINTLGALLQERGYLDVGGFSGDGKGSIPLKVEPVVIAEDTLFRGFCGFERRVTIATETGGVDTISGLRLYIEFDSLSSQVPFDFKVADRMRDFEGARMRKSLGKSFGQWPKPPRPKIKWAAVVSENKCIDITLHVSRYFDITDSAMGSTVNNILSFIINDDDISRGEALRIVDKLETLPLNK